MPTGCESPRACESRTNVGAGRSPFHVQETMPQLIGLSESYIIIYERKRGV